MNYRSTPEIVAFTSARSRTTRPDSPKRSSRLHRRGADPFVVPTQDAFEESEFVCQQILECHEEDVPLSKMAVLYRNHYDSIVLQGELVVAREFRTASAAACGFLSRLISKMCSPISALSSTRAMNRPGDGCCCICRASVQRKPAAVRPAGGRRRSARGPGDGRDDGLLPSEIEGVLRGLRRRRPQDSGREPGTRSGRRHRRGVAGRLSGGRPRVKYDRPDNRISDIEQLAVLAARYKSLERLLAELLLAGDIYGMDTVNPDDAPDSLVLSTVHQAKGLEWSRVFVLRMIEDSFPHYRALNEPGGEDEERRIFYVAVSRAMDELYLVYPMTVARRSRAECPRQAEPVLDRSRSRTLRARGRRTLTHRKRRSAWGRNRRTSVLKRRNLCSMRSALTPNGRNVSGKPSSNGS